MSDLIRFGQTDLRVSRLCQGTAFRHLPRADHPQSLEVLRYCLDQGINFFDSAQAYGWGSAEEALGKAIEGRRPEVVICTKVPPSLPPEREGVPAQPARFTRAYLTTQLEGSLRRLKTDYLDLYLLHSPDHHTPEEEIAAAMHDLVQSGKVRYWGVSNHAAAQVENYLKLANGQTAIAGIEDYYNIAGTHLDAEGRSRTRIFEEEMLPLLRHSGLGCLAFSPMDTGHLVPGRSVEPPLSDLVETIDQVAASLSVPRASVCVAWVLHQEGVTSVLSGSESPEHVDANLLGAQLELPTQALAALDEARQTFQQQQQAS